MRRDTAGPAQRSAAQRSVRRWCSRVEIASSVITGRTSLSCSVRHCQQQQQQQQPSTSCSCGASSTDRCRRYAAVMMSSLNGSSETMTSAGPTQATELDSSTGSVMPEDHSSPTDSAAFKAIFIPLYCIVFCLCFAGQLLCIAALRTRQKATQ